MNTFNLGDILRDKITGFEGMTVARHTFMSGTIQYQLAPQTLDDKGQPTGNALFDWQTLDRVSEGATIEPLALMPSFDFGDQVEDSVTDFKGTITSKSEYINGCVKYGVQPRGLDRNDDIVKPRLVDAQALLLKAKGVPPKTAAAGGPEYMPR
jgi:hypothetical protein